MKNEKKLGMKQEKDETDSCLALSFRGMYNKSRTPAFFWKRGEEKELGREDIVTARYLSDAERYADLMNGYWFGGRQVVMPEDVREKDSRMSGGFSILSIMLCRYAYL